MSSIDEFIRRDLEDAVLWVQSDLVEFDALIAAVKSGGWDPFELDLRQISTPEELYQELRHTTSAPGWYTHNYNALNNVLCDLPENRRSERLCIICRIGTKMTWTTDASYLFGSLLHSVAVLRNSFGTMYEHEGEMVRATKKLSAIWYAPAGSMPALREPKPFVGIALRLGYT